MLRFFRSIDLSAVFRVLVAFAIAMQLLQLLRFEDVLFAPEARIHSLLPFHGFLLIYLLLLFGLAIGLHKAFALLNYGFSVLLFGFYLPSLHMDYHADGFLIAGSFCLCLLRITPFWKKSEQPSELQALVGFLLLSLIATSYLDSSTYKLQSVLWRNGLGYWTPASLPFISTGAFSFLLDTEWLAKALGYSALAFEIAMPILIQFRKLRVFVVCAGILFHFGIGLIYPIPLFGLTMLTLYAGGGLIVGYSGRLNLFRLRTERGWNLVPAAMILLVWFAGLLFFLTTPAIRDEVNIRQPGFRQLEDPIMRWSALLGMSHHAVFIDEHFVGGKIEYRYELDVHGKQYNIPLSGEPTEAGNYTSDRLHSYWIFWVAQNNELRYRLLQKFARHLYKEQVGGSLDTVNNAEIVCFGRRNYVRLDRWLPGARIENERNPWVLDTVLAVNSVR